jgi:FKBP-type peptidyl-prolyl cis-trans isomerase FklB
MRILVAILISISMMPIVSIAAEKGTLTNQEEKESYSIGYQLGEGIRGKEFDVVFKALVRGMQDALAGEEPLLSKKEMKSTVLDLQKRMRLERDKATKKQAQENLEKGKAFLEENGKKEGVVTLPSGLQYKVVAAGSGKSPKPDGTVTVHYRGTFIDGTEFDSSYSRGKPEKIQVSSVIRGWTEALPLMKKGAKWQIFLPPYLGYGDRRRGRIAPNSTLVFDIELIAIDSAKGESKGG